jgi:hypothetical protein
VAETILQSGREDPRLNKAGKLHQNIRRQTQAYKKADPPTKHQKALPPEVYRFRLRQATTPRDTARAILLAGALFYAMRSCEYSKTQRKEQKTRTIRPCDISFRIGNSEIPHSSPYLKDAESITITFGDQKTDIKDEQVTQERNNDPELNPVSLWADVILRLRSYPNYDDTWPVYTFYDGRKFSHITSTEILHDIRAAVTAIGKHILGFTAADVGTHSNRSGAAMMMNLAGIPTYTIMLIGRWASDAFIQYIQKSILEFTRGVSQKMLETPTFFNIPLKQWSPPSPTYSHTATQHPHFDRWSVTGRGTSFRQRLPPTIIPTA